MTQMFGRKQWLGRRPRRKDKYKKGNCPVRKGEVLTVEIEDVTKRGDGIAKVEDFAIFVPGTKAGDRVRIKITEIKKTSAEAKAME